MFKVLAIALVTAGLLVLSRYWAPARGKGIYQGVRGGFLGCTLACFMAVVLASAFPGPYRLAIYTLGLNLLLTPTLATAGTIWGIGMKPRKKPESKKKSQPNKGFAAKGGPLETPAFAEVMAQAAGSNEVACEEAFSTSNEE